jgi:hypothetical protein
MSCSLLKVSRLFEGESRLHLQGQISQETEVSESRRLTEAAVATEGQLNVNGLRDIIYRKMSFVLYSSSDSVSSSTGAGVSSGKPRNAPGHKGQ